MADISEEGIIDNVDGDQSDADEAEEKAVNALAKEYKQGRKFDSDAYDQYGIDRAYASGDSGKNWASSANLIGTFIDILSSFLYARDPDVSASAAKNVGGIDPDNVAFAETAGIIVSRLWKKGRLKKAARKMVRSTLSVGPGWLKVIMTHETRVDPVVQTALNDLEDNVQRLELVQKQLQDPEGDENLTDDETTVKLQEMELLKVSLTEKLEVIHRSGLAIDFVQAENMQVSLDVDSISDHLDANWNANKTYVLKDNARSQFKRLEKKDFESATIYNQIKPKKRANDNVEVMTFGDNNNKNTRFQKSTDGGSDKDATEFVCIIELWDKRDNHIKTFIEGVKRWAVPPFQPNFATSRFYPYFNLSLFEVDGARHPQSLSFRLHKLQDEYSSKRSNSRLAAERSIPGTIFDATGVTPEDAKKVENAVSMEMIGIKSMKGDDIRKLFAEKPVAKVDPLVFDTRSVIADMERVSGVQEALSSTVTTQKTATEAKIQDAGFNSRSSSDRDTLEDLLTDLSEYTLELAIQGVPPEQAQQIAGDQAFWPADMEIEDIITLANMEIKAGTTGKPDDEKLRQSWGVLLPLVQAVMREIQAAQLTGNIPMAVALKNLLSETFKRLDERIDVEKFIPEGDPENLQPVLEEMLNSTGVKPAKVPGQTSAEANTL
ncbi:hypothetical protein LCGC14_1742670 [marine sediment metagenome]|uniref:Uncharacterized protein n=1 Tax=marine sediment metagenome TaxID=412755 RepID=A0A0F9H656_9ZZZZ